ncbi:MAG: hypothetical protein FWD86_02300, partial [Firmicutes bacterium]|nr:hypothetical protein [Bacillota bacterium]
GIPRDPFSSIGRPLGNENNSILAISTHVGGDEFAYSRAGIISDDFLIKAQSFYRLEFWYNSINLDGSICAVISGQSTIPSTKFELVPVAISGLSSDNNANRYGWQRSSFFITGSLIEDVNLNLQFWIGRDNEDGASGIALFDHITLTELNYIEFNEQSAGASGQVAIDAPNHESSIANGFFGTLVREIDHDTGLAKPLTFPAVPSSWRFIDTASSDTFGHSRTLRSIDNAIHGVVPTNREHFEEQLKEGNYPFIQRPVPLYDDESFINRNVLLMYSSEKTAFAYRSASFNIGHGDRVAVAVNMLAETQGAGATILLKSAGRILASIDNIFNTSGQFNDFVIYVEGGGNTSDLTLEIWLGMTDKGDNTTRMASGHIAVAGVDIIHSPHDFFDKYEQFNDLKNPTPSHFAVYSANPFTFNNFDRLSDSAIRDSLDLIFSNPTGANAVAGIVPRPLPNIQNQVPTIFNSAIDLLDNPSQTTAILRNLAPGHTTLSSPHAFNLDGNTFYRVDFVVMVDLQGIDYANGYDLNNIVLNPNDPEQTVAQKRDRIFLDQARAEQAMGLTISLSDYSIENIRDTISHEKVLTDRIAGTWEHIHAFETFSFYFATNEEGETLAWSIDLGGAFEAEIAGSAFINSISLNPIEAEDFDLFVEEIDEMDEDDRPGNFLIVDRRVETDDIIEDDIIDDEEEGQTSGGGFFDSPWGLVGAILLPLGVLVAIGGVLVKKLLERRKGKKHKEKVVSYDRRRGFSDEEAITQAEQEAELDSFDDDIYVDGSAKVSDDEFEAVDTIADFDDDVDGSGVVLVRRRKRVVEESDFDDDAPAFVPKVKKSKAIENEFDDEVALGKVGETAIDTADDAAIDTGTEVEIEQGETETAASDEPPAPVVEEPAPVVEEPAPVVEEPEVKEPAIEEPTDDSTPKTE